MTTTEIMALKATHRSATNRVEEHATALELLQSERIYDYMLYVGQKKLRHHNCFKILVKQVKKALSNGMAILIEDATSRRIVYVS